MNTNTLVWIAVGGVVVFLVWNMTQTAKAASAAAATTTPAATANSTWAGIGQAVGSIFDFFKSAVEKANAGNG